MRKRSPEHVGLAPGTATPRRRVALLIEATRSYARGLIRGVARYNREHQGWSIHFMPRGLGEPPPKWLAKWEGDGILARIDDRQMADAVLATGLPVVEMRRLHLDLGLPTIGPDHRAVAQLAAEHLRQRGFQHFGFCCSPRGSHPTTDALAESFVQSLAQVGRPCKVLYLPRGRRTSPGEDQLDAIRKWLIRLPKPLGVMACNDDRALQVLEACRRSGFRVPDEVAVVGAGNDDCLCNLALPSLTSVDLNPQRIGYEAAELLDRLMLGERAPQAHTLVEPRGIAMRLSTDVLATDDQAVVKAISFIREHTCERIQVADVFRHANMSQAALEPRFKAALGRTVYQEVQRVRVERVKQLLADTDLPLKQVAHRAGFQYTEYMMRVFRRATGQTAKQYREDNRS